MRLFLYALGLSLFTHTALISGFVLWGRGYNNNALVFVRKGEVSINLEFDKEKSEQKKIDNDKNGLKKAAKIKEEVSSGKRGSISGKDARNINPDPEYPVMAIRFAMEGTVIIEYIINENGDIDQCKIVKSSGHEMLDKSALRTVKNEWKFPLYKYKEYINKPQLITFIFKLEQ